MLEELKQSGYLSNIRYKVVLSTEFEKLYQEAIKQIESSGTWDLLAERGRNFPLSARQVSSIDLSKASSADIGTLIRYFGFRDKGIEEILENIEYERIE